MIVTVAASVALAGCANCSLDSLRRLAGSEPEHAERKTAAVERKTEHAATPAAAPAAEPVAVQAAVDPASEKRKWCDQRFIDYQDGKRPGGAATVAEKQADDRECEAVRKSDRIETGTIPAR